MNRNLLFLLSICILFANCKKDSETGPELGSSYQPVSKNSFWKYQSTSGTTPGATTGAVTTTSTMTGNSSTINGKLYYEAKTVASDVSQSGISHFCINNHFYSQRAAAGDVTIELTYLNDTAKVNYSWTKNVTDNGTVHSYPARIIGKIKEKDIDKTVNGITFKNVIHTEVKLQYDYSDGFETASTYDYYAAKGVGTIQVDTFVDTFGYRLYHSAKLIEYSIK